MHVKKPDAVLKKVNLGRAWADRPVITIFALRSENDSGVMTDWNLPASYLNGLLELETSGSSGGDDSPVNVRH